MQEDQRFAELASNCMAVIKHFNQRVEAAKERGGWAWSVERILHVITGESKVRITRCKVSELGPQGASC